jgi:hypothetical protein
MTRRGEERRGAMRVKGREGKHAAEEEEMCVCQNEWPGGE